MGLFLGSPGRIKGSGGGGGSEIDPIFAGSPAATITDADILSWKTSAGGSYVTTNSTQASLSGSKTWTSLHSFSAGLNTIGLGRGAVGSPLDIQQTGATNILARFQANTGNLHLQAPGSAPTDTGYRLTVSGDTLLNGNSRTSGNFVQSNTGSYYSYNTVDETTNWERGYARWNGNVFELMHRGDNVNFIIGRNVVNMNNVVVQPGWLIGFRSATGGTGTSFSGYITPQNGTSLLFQGEITGPATLSFYQIQFKARFNTLVSINDQVNTHSSDINNINNELVSLNRKFKYSGFNQIDFNLNNVAVSLETSNTYTHNGTPDTLMIICHGNGQNVSSAKPPTAFRNFLRANQISLVTIQMQDQTASPFTSKASGWGNEICLQRVINLYNYLMAYYNFNSSVILSGRSMGGLSMGTLALTKAFPIRFCLGIGVVPSLKTMFTNGGANRKEPIRNAYGMAVDGSNDAQIDTYIQGYDWFSKSTFDIAGSKYKIFDQRLYILAGNDTTVQNEFGGDAKYLELKDAINRAGGYCYYNLKQGVGHDDGSLFADSVAQGVWLKEMGIPIVTI